MKFITLSPLGAHFGTSIGSECNQSPTVAHGFRTPSARAVTKPPTKPAMPPINWGLVDLLLSQCH
ncbi:MAG: hypothetical protein ABW185_06190 [Sedimenticola sp.]